MKRIEARFWDISFSNFLYFGVEIGLIISFVLLFECLFFMLFFVFFGFTFYVCICKGRFDVKLEIFFKESDSVDNLKLHFGNVLYFLLVRRLKGVLLLVHLVLNYIHQTRNPLRH